uniref:mannan endo-1,4-beta-mannosidase n=1 Tax=Puccinia cf. psidii AE-2014 TaxID=1505670 RepID=A0A060IEC5_9BASI|nr:Glycosyl hydrolase family 2 [Puccinia cf. psidii AE-2014]
MKGLGNYSTQLGIFYLFFISNSSSFKTIYQSFNIERETTNARSDFPLPSRAKLDVQGIAKETLSPQVKSQKVTRVRPEIPQAMATSPPTLVLQPDQCRISENLVPQRGTNCAGGYHHPLATTISGAFGTLPTPRAFIKRDGTRLTAGSQTFRPVGPNYWLGLDENVGRRISYPSRRRVREAIASVGFFDLNTVRSITLGVSTGHPLSVWPLKGETNEDAFVAIDYAVATARHYGIRLIIPFTDNYRFYHGGPYKFLAWEGIHSNDGDLEMNFYRNASIIQTFKQYIEVILTHVNQFNGIALKDDPTILAWETGNELGAFDLEEGAPPAAWTQEIAAHIKSLDPNHLIIDGSDGVIDSDGDDVEGLDVEEIDIVSNHLYRPKNTSFWQAHGLATASNKVLLIGEYDWTGSNGGLTLSTFYNQVIKTTAGDIAWSLMSHDDECCKYVTHDDGYSIYYPNGNASLMQKKLLRLVQHWYSLTGRKPPSVLPAVTCPQPEWLEQE